MPRAASKDASTTKKSKAAAKKATSTTKKATSTAGKATAAAKKSPAPAKKATAKKPAPAGAKTSAAKSEAGARAAKSGSAGKKQAASAPKAAPTTSRPSTSEYRNFVPYQPRSGEEYMNEQQREHFKAILMRWKSELMQEVDRTVSHMKDEAANFPDPADRATQEEEFSLELRTRDRERKLIKKIDATVERIEQDDYGFCDACGVEIGVQRLEARPTATLCIDCKTLAEIKERQELG